MTGGGLEDMPVVEIPLNDGMKYYFTAGGEAHMFDNLDDAVEKAKQYDHPYKPNSYPPIHRYNPDGRKITNMETGDVSVMPPEEE